MVAERIASGFYLHLRPVCSWMVHFASLKNLVFTSLDRQCRVCSDDHLLKTRRSNLPSDNPPSPEPCTHANYTDHGLSGSAGLLEHTA
jgi:hypothetical protein